MSPHGDGPVLVACDLDRTLIWSRAACGLAEGDHGGDPADALVCVERYLGRPASFVTPRAAAGLDALARAATFVPATTRTAEQLARVALPGAAGTPTWAVAANGGLVLAEGRVDQDWSRTVARRLEATAAPLVEVEDHLATVLVAPWTLRRRTAEELFCYAVLERDAVPDGVVADLTAWCAERGWTVSVQGRKLYAVPVALTKQAALAEIADRVGPALTLAAGDSLLDAGMLAWADAAVRPPEGELAAAVPLHDPDGLTVVERLGALGGEDMVAWLLERVGRAMDERAHSGSFDDVLAEIRADLGPASDEETSWAHGVLEP